MFLYRHEGLYHSSENILQGGLGAMSEWEGFGPDYVLPNETGR